MSVVTINRAGVERYFERQAFGGALTGVGRTAEQLADRMVQQAVRNASGQVVRRRTGQLEQSVKKIVRRDPKTGVIEIGVGTTLEYGGFLERGTPAHQITARNRKYLRSAPGHPDPLRARRLTTVNHPGFEAKLWLRKAVDHVIGRNL